MKKKIKYLDYIKKYEISIASVLVILLVIFLVFNTLIPNINRADQIYSQGQDFKKRLDILTHKNNILASLDYQLYKDTFAKLNQVLPESKDYVSLIISFDALEKQTGVKILRSDFQLGVFSTNSAKLVQIPGNSAYPVPLSLEVLGDLESIKKVQKTIANLTGRFMVFDEMSTATKPDGILDVTFTGKAFFYPLPTTLGSVDTPLLMADKLQEAILKSIGELNLPSISESSEIDKNSVGKTNLFE